MPTTQQLRSRLIKKLKELFQLNQPDLDFGFYRVMHAKAEQVETFLDKDLLKIVAEAFGQTDDAQKAKLQAEYEKAIEQAKKYGAPDPENTDAVLEAKAALDAAKETVNAEGEIYDHLYRFFERYYDGGDFLSKRYYTRETSGKSAPFAVPYNGEEVKLHWANADQYYIKTTEYFSSFTFDLATGAKLQLEVDKKDPKQAQMDFDAYSDLPETLKVHFKIVDASEGEHGNVKASDETKRFFMIHKDNPVELNEQGELVCHFEYKPDSEKGSKQEGSWRQHRNNEAVTEILKTLEALDNSSEYQRLLAVPAPTDKNKDRPLLAKYVNQYTARNTMDYFIHKDLGGFLSRELDFYIKNEVIRLDDIENADVPAVESYLAKIKVLRKIAGKLIRFLAQLEEFQKKLWLKKKFVTETNYCITLDRVPEELYGQITANDTQREEWINLFSIDEIKAGEGDLLKKAIPAYSNPLAVEFLKANNKLVLDTKFFSDDFKHKLIASIENFDEQCDGLLIHSENFQALNLLQKQYQEQVKCVHIDPPYNTASSGFFYKNEYQHSSWLTLMQERNHLAFSYLSNPGVFSCHIDEYEMERLHLSFEQTQYQNAGTMVWDKGMPIAGANGLATQHEYVLFRTKGNAIIRIEKKNIEKIHQKITELIESHGTEHSKAISKYRKWLKSQVEFTKSEKTYDSFDESSKAYRSDNMSATDKRKNEKFHIPLVHPETGQACPVPDHGWRYTPESLSDLNKKGLLLFGKDHATMPRKKTYLENTTDSQMSTIYRSGARGKSLLDNFGLLFPFSHSVDFYCYIIGAAIDSDDIMLDFFAGSGTSGHAIIHLNREDDGCRKYILVEMGKHFDNVTKPRIQKVIYSESWKDGKPTARETGISHCFKYLRLESYEDALNNLVFDGNPARELVMAKNDSLREDYMLGYMLDVETRGSQSLLNIDAFSDPTRYQLTVKKPGTDESEVRPVDLLETFNYLIGLRVEHIAVPQTFSAKFKREPDPELPGDQNTRLILDGKLKQENDGPWWFRKVEGWLPADANNPNNGQKEKVLIVWRKLTGDLEKDNAVLDEWFQKNRISTRDFEFGTIYVNGSNNLPNLQLEGDTWKVRLIEEDFMKNMWETEG